MAPQFVADRRQDPSSLLSIGKNGAATLTGRRDIANAGPAPLWNT